MRTPTPFATCFTWLSSFACSTPKCIGGIAANSLSSWRTSLRSHGTTVPVVCALFLAHALRCLFGSDEPACPDLQMYELHLHRLKKPNDLSVIEEKLRSRQYPELSFQAFKADCLLMTANALALNRPGTLLHLRARALENFIRVWQEPFEEV